MNPEETIQVKELCLEIIAERDEARYPELAPPFRRNFRRLTRDAIQRFLKIPRATRPLNTLVLFLCGQANIRSIVTM